MIYIIGYLLIGLALCFLLRTDDDNVAFLDTGLAILILLTWPFLVFYLATKIKRLKWKGKVVWEKK